MSSVKLDKVIYVGIPDRRYQKSHCIKNGRSCNNIPLYHAPMKDLEEHRLPRDVFQRNGKVTEGLWQNNGK